MVNGFDFTNELPFLSVISILWSNMACTTMNHQICSTNIGTETLPPVYLKVCVSASFISVNLFQYKRWVYVIIADVLQGCTPLTKWPGSGWLPASRSFRLPKARATPLTWRPCRTVTWRSVWPWTQAVWLTCVCMNANLRLRDIAI